MTLEGGSFDFQPVDRAPRRTRVTLTTTYRPHLRPRWCWRPFEKYTVHTLHAHVLRGMDEQALARAAADVESRPLIAAGREAARQ